MVQLDHHCALAWWFYQERLHQLYPRIVIMMRREDRGEAWRLVKACGLVKDLEPYKRPVWRHEVRVACKAL